MDSNGKIYETFLYSILPSVGVFETFQIRQIRGIDINNIESMSLNLNLEDELNDKKVSFTIYNKNESKLELVK